MGHGPGLLLLTAVAGYWLLERAEAHKGDLRRAGRVLGWLIIVVSLVGVACDVWCLAKCKGGSRFFPKRGGFCPMTPKDMPQPAQPQ